MEAEPEDAEDSSHELINQTIYPTTEVDESTSAANNVDYGASKDDGREGLNGYQASEAALSRVPQSQFTSGAVSPSLDSTRNGANYNTMDGSTSPSSMASSRMSPTSFRAAFFSIDRSDAKFKTTLPTVTVNIPPPSYKPLPYATGRSGVVYDTRMRFHVSLKPDEDGRPHDEDPRRIAEIYNELRDAGLLPDEGKEANEHQLVRIGIRQATFAELCLVHSENHVSNIEKTAGMSNDALIELGSYYDSMYFHNLSWMSATLSAGGAIEATKAVVKGLVRNSFAIIRPPGHHAETTEPSGFCFFNNVPIAVKTVQADFPDECRKVLILDWDVHHGNGIQKAFYEDPNVLYISLHVHENGRFYPKGFYKDHLHCGEGAGLGRNVNIPWSSIGMGDADYMFAFQQIVMPICIEFDPDLVMISAGFDAARGDPLGACNVTPAGFAHMTHMLKQLAKGRVVACLEGGYNLRSIATSALAMVRVLMGEPPDRLVDLVPSIKAVEVVQQVIRTQAKFWRCLYPKDANAARNKLLGSERLHDIVRDWQAQKLFDEYQMISLPMLRQSLSKSFRNQVLATPNYFENRPLLLIFHDPPEALGYPDPRTNKLELHNTFLTDLCKTYVDWAVKHGFSVMDVNIPRHLTGLEDDGEYAERGAEAARAAMTKDLAQYIWQNYIEINDASHIFLLGIGDAYAGILELLSTNDSVFSSIDLTTSFVAENALRAIRGVDESAIATYFARSLVFVAEDHPAFDPERMKKIKKRYGKVVRSGVSEMQEMLFAHREQVFARWLAETEEWRVEGVTDGVADDVRAQDGAEIEDALGDFGSRDELAEPAPPAEEPDAGAEPMDVDGPVEATYTATVGAGALPVAHIRAKELGSARGDARMSAPPMAREKQSTGRAATHSPSLR